MRYNSCYTAFSLRGGLCTDFRSTLNLPPMFALQLSKTDSVVMDNPVAMADTFEESTNDDSQRMFEQKARA